MARARRSPARLEATPCRVGAGAGVDATIVEPDGRHRLVAPAMPRRAGCIGVLAGLDDLARDVEHLRAQMAANERIHGRRQDWAAARSARRTSACTIGTL